MKNNLNDFWKVFERLCNENDLKDGRDYEIEDRRRFLYLKITTMNNIYITYYETSDGVPLSFKEFLKLDLFNNYKKLRRIFSDGSYTWCLRFEFTKLGISINPKIVNVRLKGELVLELSSKQDWVNRVPRELPEKSPSDILVWIDKNGNGLSIGADFMAAEKMDSYPVKVYKVVRCMDVMGGCKCDKFKELETKEVFPLDPKVGTNG